MAYGLCMALLARRVSVALLARWVSMALLALQASVGCVGAGCGMDCCVGAGRVWAVRAMLCGPLVVMGAHAHTMTSVGTRPHYDQGGHTPTL
jgi:hypothetical protein